MHVKKLPKHERDISENPDTTEVKDAKKWNGGSRLFGQAIRLVVGQDSASRDHTPPGNRNRPRQAHHRSDSPVKTLANSDVGGTSRDVGTTPRRRSFNRSFEKDFRGKGPRELHRPCPIHEQTTLGVPGNPEPECGEENTMQSAVVFSDCPRTMDQEEDSVPCEENVPTGSLRVPTDSAQTAKDIEILRQYVQFRPALSKEPQLTPDGHVIIDPAVRERIANPEYPVRMPDKPFENLSFYDYTTNKGKASTNISQVHGLFGRKWRERSEKQQERQYAEEDAKSEDDVLDIRDDTCPMFMIWGICRWGDRCPLRHPPYRYLQRPKRTAPEPLHEEPKARDPNSYAAIVEKSRTKKQEEFFNDAVSKVCGTTEETLEAWPALGSPGQGSCNTIAPKAWGPKGEAPTCTGPQVWDLLSTTKEAPWNSTINQLQIANDELIADNLQVEEYSQLSEYDGYEADYEEDYNYYPEQGLNEDEYIEEIEEEELNSCTHSSPVEQNSDQEFSEGVAQPNIIISNVCDICLDRPKDATLVCGHRYCYQCALQMRLDERVCAICRRCIVSVIKTYN